METTLSKSIRTTDKKADYDAACKELLSEKIILGWILRDCLDEFRDMDAKEIAERYIEGKPQISEVPVMPDEKMSVAPNEEISAISEKEISVTAEEEIPVIPIDGYPGKIIGDDTEDKTVNEGTVKYDIRFRAIVPGSEEQIRLIVNVEAQNDFYPGYPLITRGIYYCGRMISSQYGREFTDSHYEKIKKVYSIWICMHPPKARKSSITRYRIKEENVTGNVTERPQCYDLMSIIMVCLGRSDENHYSGVLKLLDVLLSDEINQKEKRRVLEDDFNIPMTEEIEGRVNVMCNLSEGVFRRGEEQGMVKGAEKKQLENISNLMDSMKLTLEQAMAALKIPEEEQLKYRKFF